MSQGIVGTGYPRRGSTDRPAWVWLQLRWRSFLDSLPPWYVGVMAALIVLVIPLALLRYQLYLVVGGIVALLVLALIVTEPFVGLLIFLGLLYMRPEEYIQALAGARLTLIVSMIALFAWVINALLCKERFRFHLPAVQCFLGFLVVAIASTAFSAMDVVGEVTMDLVKLFTLFILIVHLVRTPARLRGSLAILVLFSAGLGVQAIWKYQNGEAMVYQGGLRAVATGIFSDPNDLSLAMAMAMPLALGQVCARGRPPAPLGPVARRGCPPTRSVGDWFERVLGFASVPILLYTVYLSDSRGGMLALAASLFLYFRRRLRRWGIVLGVVGVIGLFAFGPSRMNQMSVEEDSAAGRIEAWHAGLEMLKMSPLWGVGKTQFNAHHWLTAHNSLVLCLAEVGLVGGMFWIGLFYFNFRDGKRVADASREEEKAESLAPLVPSLLQISLMTFMVGGFFLSRTYTVPLYVYLGLTVAAMQVAATPNRDLQERLDRSTPRDWRQIALLTVGSVICIAVLVQLWR